MHPDELARMIFSDILRTQAPDIRRDDEMTWRRVLSFKQSSEILTASTSYKVDPLAGTFQHDSKTIYWNLSDSFLITFIFRVIVTPIDEANYMLARASEMAKGEKGIELVTAMLLNLKVIGVLDKHLTLIPRKPFLYASMIKRQDKILQAIQAADPAVKSITIISGV